MKKYYVYALALLLFSCSSQKKQQSFSQQSAWQIPKGVNVIFNDGVISLKSSKFSLNKRRKAEHYHLITKKKYKDFTFEAEILIEVPELASSSKKPLAKKLYGNSGIYFRGTKKSDYLLIDAYQYELDPSPRGFSGGLYIEDYKKRKWTVPKYTYKSKGGKYYLPTEKSAVEFKRKFGKLYQPGKWNKVKIVCSGDNMKFFLNGVQTVDFNDSYYKEGYIALQHHGEENRVYKFRNIKISE